MPEADTPEQRKQESTLNDLLSDALDMACMIGFEGDCPYSQFDIEPWSEPCDEACKKYNNEQWKCWRQYFISRVG